MSLGPIPVEELTLDQLRAIVDAARNLRNAGGTPARLLTALRDAVDAANRERPRRIVTELRPAREGERVTTPTGGIVVAPTATTDNRWVVVEEFTD